MRKEADQKLNIGGAWHADHSYAQIPVTGSILAAKALPPTGGDTLFASMYAAYDSLAEATRTRLLGLRALLEELFTHAQRPEHIYRFEWKGGQLVPGSDPLLAKPLPCAVLLNKIAWWRSKPPEDLAVCCR